MRRAVAGVLVGALTVLGAGAASAAWTTAGAGAGTAAATVLQPAADPLATATSSTSITVTWKAPTTGPAPSGYRVERVATPSVTLTCTPGALSCTDSGLAPGTPYEYRVTSLLHAWGSAPVEADSETAAQAVTLTISSPAAGADRVPTQTTFSGTTSTPSNGVVTVRVYLGSPASSNLKRTLVATPAATTGSWSVSLSANNGNTDGRLDRGLQYTVVVSQSGATDVTSTFTTGSA